MSVLEYLEWLGVDVNNIDDRMWWIGWEDSFCMGRSYDGWKELSSSADGRYERYAALVVEYISYCKKYANDISDHYVYNEPGASHVEVVVGNQRGGVYE